MVFYTVSSKKDLVPGKMIGANAGGKEILVANVDGNYFAIGNRCTHNDCTLSDGELKEGIVECPCHFSQFEVQTGRVVGGPAKVPEQSFEVKVEGDQVSVNI